MDAVVPMSALVRDAMRETGATVVVEDALPPLQEKAPERIRLLGSNLRLHLAPRPLPPGEGPVPLPVWADPSVIRQGGNVVGRIYTFGGGSF
jgi:hypothetical protein